MSISSSPHRSLDSKGPGILLGIGLGGFADGILLHQIAQWHNMLSSRVPPTQMEAMRLNMRWDGAFHLAVWVATVAGVFWLLHDAQSRRLPSRKTFVAQLFFGWGCFNVVEGVVDHHLLQLHHVRDLPVHLPVYDWLFLGLAGVGFLVTGWLGMRRPLDR